MRILTCVFRDKIRKQVTGIWSNVSIALLETVIRVAFDRDLTEKQKELLSIQKL
jgi:hypothetical protein